MGQRHNMAGKLFLGLAGVAMAACFSGNAAAQPTPETIGRYKIVMEMDSSLPEHVIYRPENLAAVKDKLPVVAFGNGGCSNAGNAFEFYLREIASHGFLVVANGPIDSAPLPAGRPPKPNEKPDYSKVSPGQVKQTKTEQLFETMDWAKAQNLDEASRYFGKLDPGTIAVMGQSCGGLQALEAAGDPRVKTALIINSGIMRGGPPRAGLILPASPESLTKLHTPVIYIIGGETDIAYANAEKDFIEIKNIPVFKANLDVGHNGTLWQPHGGKFAEVATQWLLWQFKHDKNASAWFLGENCGLCRDQAWKIERKNMK
jgi:dienelactone hydrolase